MVCLYMSELNGKRYCLAGMCDKEICDDEKNCRFYVDLDEVKKKGVWDRFGFGREEEGEGDEVGWGMPPKEEPSPFITPSMPQITAEHPISSSHFIRCKGCD